MTIRGVVDRPSGRRRLRVRRTQEGLQAGVLFQRGQRGQVGGGFLSLHPGFFRARHQDDKLLGVNTRLGVFVSGVVGDEIHQ